MNPEHFDAIVLGTGQAGKPLALDLAGAGRRTAVIELEFVGGTQTMTCHICSTPIESCLARLAALEARTCVDSRGLVNSTLHFRN